MSYKRLVENEKDGYVVHLVEAGDASVKIQVPLDLIMRKTEGRSDDGVWILELGNYQGPEGWVEEPDDLLELEISVREDLVEIVKSTGVYEEASFQQVGDLWILQKSPGESNE